MFKGRITAAALIAFAVLAGCEGPTAVEPVPRPPERPTRPAPRTETPPPPSVESADSQALQAYYRRVQDGLVAQGLLRTDGGGPDTPFGPRQLVENFVRVALFEEYSTVGGSLVARPTATRLHRWERPITMQLEFGETVSPRIKTRDRNALISYANRLSRLTGLPIRQVSQGGNFNVFIVNEDERRALGPRLRQLVPGLDELAVRAVTQLPKNSYCLVFALDGGNNSAYTHAVAVIRAEHPDLLRLSCIHEEIAQGMGLANDSPSARPSIFNDDEEFALLTTHDEMLLKMLYDKRMRVGMTADEARPVAQTIAAELLGGES
ncbi:DUF2927 domain-containing protein [Oceaniglobus indicus]|uniref:DUF2927 domain-containing protein n=1 Tax=Oceaniglobus indicus TaxID=2047749 RepID=UPI000C19F42E|nr:DUF2927 domain-containing protein [Oceaniglobus indicus]